MKQFHEPIPVEVGDDGLPYKRIGRLAAAGAAPVAWHLVDLPAVTATATPPARIAVSAAASRPAQHALGLGESMGRPWDDFDNAIYRSHMLTYPTVDGIVGTLQWEGVRAAVDDVRYATTLREAATSAIGSADPAAVALGEAARAWLEQVDILGDLGALRQEMGDHIRELQSAV